MDQQTRVAQVFDQVAESYDSVGVAFFRPIAAHLVDQLRLQPGERVADIGSGRGAVLFQAAAAVGTSGHVVGLDVSPRMIELAAADARTAGLEVELVVGDAMAPDLPASSFDVVASSLVLFFLPDPAAALRAWRELLVDGGRIGVSTFGPYSDRWAEEVDGVFKRYTPPDAADARTSGRTGPFASDEGMEALLRDAGFTDIGTVTEVVSPRFDDPDHWYRWSMSVGQRQFWMNVPTDRLAAVKADVLAAVDRCRGSDGRIGFDQQVRYTLGRR